MVHPLGLVKHSLLPLPEYGLDWTGLGPKVSSGLKGQTLSRKLSRRWIWEIWVKAFLLHCFWCDDECLGRLCTAADECRGTRPRNWGAQYPAWGLGRPVPGLGIGALSAWMREASPYGAPELPIRGPEGFHCFTGPEVGFLGAKIDPVARRGLR